MKTLEFENAHCHSVISNVLIGFPDSPTFIEDYAKEYNERGMQCLCLSEHSYRSDVWAQANAAAKYDNMKAICAAEVYFVPDRNPELKDKRNFHLLLIAKNKQGFKELNSILSESQKTGFYGNGRVDFDLLSRLNYKNFICSTACVGGIFKDANGEKMALQLSNIFKENFRLEIQYHLNKVQIEHNKIILDMYKKYRWPLLFATDSHYINKEDKILRKELQLSKGIQMDDSEWDLYLPTPQEAFDMMVSQNVFSKSQIEESFENTLELREFEGFTYTTERKFPVSHLEMTPDQRSFLYQKMVCDGYISKEGQPNKEDAAELRSEMNTIVETDSYDYFIGLHDLVEKGIENGGVLTTTSRGSACGFATNFGLGFTSINRLHSPVKMYPGRFLSKAKLAAGSMPDIDLNLANPMVFEQAGKQIFGENGCYPMIAYGKTKTLSAFKLLAKARNLDFTIANEVSKQINAYEFDRKVMQENNQDDPDYDVDDYIDIKDYVEEKYLTLIEDSKKYQGLPISLSPHPCARLVYHKNLIEEIGIVRLKEAKGTKDPKYCVFIDGTTADAAGYCKIDLN